MKERLDKSRSGTSLAVQWLRLHALLQKAWVQSPVAELGSHIPHGGAKNEKKRGDQTSLLVKIGVENIMCSGFFSPLISHPKS